MKRQRGPDEGRKLRQRTRTGRVFVATIINILLCWMISMPFHLQRKLKVRG